MEIFEFQGYEAVVFGELVGVDDDELQVTERLGQGYKFRLELVEELREVTASSKVAISRRVLISFRISPTI